MIINLGVDDRSLRLPRPDAAKPLQSTRAVSAVGNND
jgi:hypothetical protein